MEFFSPHFIIKSELSNKKISQFYMDFFKDAPIKIPSPSIKMGTLYDTSSKEIIITLDNYTYGLEGVVHEMCHIAEMEDPKRLLEQDYGFGSVINSNVGYNCKKAFEREMKVFAYEASIFKYLRKRFPVETFMDNMSVVVSGSDIYSFKKYFGHSDNVNPLIRKEFPKYKKIYTIEKFKEEWSKKMEFLKGL